MAAVDDLLPSHPEHIFAWMVAQPECAASVAGQIFWRCEPAGVITYKAAGFHSEQLPIMSAVVDRWRRGRFAPSTLDFSRFAEPGAYRSAVADLGGSDPLQVPTDLLEPEPGEIPAPLMLVDDFEYWCWRTSTGNLVKRPRDAAVEQWRESIAWRDARQAEEQDRADAAAAPASWVERLVYGGKFTGAQSEMDRAWSQFKLITAAGAALFIAVGRLGLVALAFGIFLAWVGVVSFYQSFVRLGGAGRILGWWAVALALVALLTMLFRFIDFGSV